MERVRIRGETYVSLEGVAACYRVDAAWVREVYEHGLLGDGERHGRSIVIHASLLDRVARILRMHLHQGVDLEMIALLLEPEADRPPSFLRAVPGEQEEDETRPQA